MINFISNIGRILPCMSNCIRPFCIKSNKIDSAIDYKVNDIFSPEEHAKILDTLNDSTPEDLSRYKISNVRINGILAWKKKRGPFKTLDEVLEVEGLGKKTFEQICKNITTNSVSEVKFRPPKQNRQFKQLLVPEMSPNSSTSLQSAVAIHLDPTGIGWASLERVNNLTNWKCENFSSLPTKMLPSHTFNLAVDLVGKTPPGDAYIFEAPPNLSPQNQTKQGIVSTHNQQVELLSMLLALLNTSTKHNKGLQKCSAEEYYTGNIRNRVFYLRNRIPARLFNTLIGFEKVSAISIITGILSKDPKVLQSLPCTAVTFDPNLNHNFANQSPTDKELLAQALMLGVSFMDLCIYRSAISYEALKSNRHRKKEPPSKQINLG